MSKVITIKLTKSSGKVGPFSLYDQANNLIVSGVSKQNLLAGFTYRVEDSVTAVKLVNQGSCNMAKTHAISSQEIPSATPFVKTISTCLFKHLVQVDLFNNFYGDIHPYILEHPFSYNEKTEILQSIKNYSKVFKYTPDETGVLYNTNKIETDEDYFNKMVVYNNQQSSGIVNLVKKPKNNLKEYSRYPMINIDSTSVIFTKSDGFYNVNGFYDVVKDKTQKLFVPDVDSMSIDRQVNQNNMLYTQKSFKKSLLRAKHSKTRFILDNRSDIHIVSSILIQSNQINYK